ncbi:MAG: hypothetical protein IJ806_00370 [Ruminococcus sp.]|nr:hypothetical protein [Ruminococcus sp.]
MKKRKFFVGFTAAALAAGMMAMSASAEPTGDPSDPSEGGTTSAAASNFTYEPVNGGRTEIKKYLVLDSDATVPTQTFNYSITAGEEAKYTGTGKTDTIAAYAGVGAENISDVSVSFGPADGTTAGAEGDGITNDEGKKYAVNEFTVDFSRVEFPEPGVYRYVLTELNAGATDELGAGISHVGNYQKTLDVYVTDNNGSLEVSQYILYNGVIDTPPAIDDDTSLVATVDRTDEDNSDKTDGFVNNYSSQDLTIGKKVTGNQGSKDKYFKFTVTFTNAKGANITIDSENSHFSQAPAKNSATIYSESDMAGANGVDDNDAVTGQQLAITDNAAASYDFYLQNGEYITFLGLPSGSSYTVAEAAEEYTSVAASDTSFTIGEFTFNGALEGEIANADIITGFTNNKNGAIPTGVIMSVAGPAGVGAAVVGGIVYLTIKKKKEENED